MINIEGLEKAAVLAGLYNAAQPRGMGFLHYDPQPMTVVEAEEILKTTNRNFDYLRGRPLKVDLRSDKEFDERLYERDNGKEIAHLVVAHLRLGFSPDGNLLQDIHKAGLPQRAEDARELANTKSSFDGHTFTLGADDAGLQLKEAIDKALDQK